MNALVDLLSLDEGASEGSGLDLVRLKEMVGAQAVARRRQMSNGGEDDGGVRAIQALISASSTPSQKEGKTMHFDRIVSIECLEHSRNYELLFKWMHQVSLVFGV